MAPNNALKKSRLGEEAPTAPAVPRGSAAAAAGVASAELDPSFDVTPEWLAQQAADGAAGGRAVSAAEVRARGDGRGGRAARCGPEALRLLTAVMFLTRLPVPPWCDHDPAVLVPGMAWFPAVGAAVGLWAGALFDALAAPLGARAAACGSTLGTVWLCGCFHEDGLADTLDGFGGGWGKQQILRIMKDSRCGTYAVVGSCLALLAKVELLARIHAGGGGASGCGAAAALAAAHCVARAAAVLMCRLFPYVADDGDDKGLLYNSFAGCLRRGLLTRGRVAAALVTAAAVSRCALGGAYAAAVLGVATGAALLAGRYAVAVLGGVIGDYLGATIIAVELLVYAVLAADVEAAALPAGGAGVAALLASPAGALLRASVLALLPALLMPGAGDLPGGGGAQEGC